MEKLKVDSLAALDSVVVDPRSGVEVYTKKYDFSISAPVEDNNFMAIKSNVNKVMINP